MKHLFLSAVILVGAAMSCSPTKHTSKDEYEVTPLEQAKILILNSRSWKKEGDYASKRGDTLEARICYKVCDKMLYKADSLLTSIEK